MYRNIFLEYANKFCSSMLLYVPKYLNITVDNLLRKTVTVTITMLSKIKIKQNYFLRNMWLCKLAIIGIILNTTLYKRRNNDV
jgi:hypothetical protein